MHSYQKLILAYNFINEQYPSIRSKRLRYANPKDKQTLLQKLKILKKQPITSYNQRQRRQGQPHQKINLRCQQRSHTHESQNQRPQKRKSQKRRKEK